MSFLTDADAGVREMRRVARGGGVDTTELIVAADYADYEDF